MDIVLFALLGLAAGSIYGLLAQGLVLVYRGSGLLNFAQGAVAMAGGYLYYELTTKQGLPGYIGLAVTVMGCGLIGVAIQVLVLRPIRNSSALSRVIATLGVLIVFQSLAVLRYGPDPIAVDSLLPLNRVVLFNDDLGIGADRLIIIGIGIGVTAALVAITRATGFGRAMSAVSQSEVIAASLGHSPDKIAILTWSLASGLAGLAGALIAPILYLEPLSLVLLVIPAMCAALIGGFTSFGRAYTAALLIGVGTSEISRFSDIPGLATAAPFVVIILVLMIGGRGIPLRDFVLDRLPSVSPGRIRPVPVLLACIAMATVINLAGAEWGNAFSTTLSWGIVCLSVVVVTGYAGQLSLAQSVIAGVGALVAAHLDSRLPFIAALVVALLIAGVGGVILALPALRLRGATLAVATLGLGGAAASMILGNQNLTGGFSGILVESPSVFGIDLDPFFYPERYAYFVLGVLTICTLAVANLRRGRIGRQLLAVRSSELAATAHGISVAATKCYAFGIGAGLAACGGILLAFHSTAIAVTGPGSLFTVFGCVLLVAAAVAGGVGWAGGALFGSTMMAGGVFTQVMSGWDSAAAVLPLLGGVALLATLIFQPDGAFPIARRDLRRLTRRLLGRQTVGTPSHAVITMVETTDQEVPDRVDPQALTVHGLSVSFGGVHALNDVDICVRPGTIHGLIGPNGAGKTTLIDAVTGFVASAGTVSLGRRDITSSRPLARARAGMTRSFQSLELFNDLTVAENLAAGCDHPPAWAYVTDMIRPRRLTLPKSALEAVRLFELGHLLDASPDDLSFGQRKAVAIARAVAGAPSVLLLDEPAAGLDDREADELAELIRILARHHGIAVLLVEHRVSLVLAISDEVTVLESGRVIAHGAPEEVREDRAVQRAYLGDASTISQ